VNEPKPLPENGEQKTPAPETAATPQAAPAKELTPEEQMAAFAEDLKEKDWGHQPC